MYCRCVKCFLTNCVVYNLNIKIFIFGKLSVCSHERVAQHLMGLVFFPLIKTKYLILLRIHVG